MSRDARLTVLQMNDTHAYLGAPQKCGRNRAQRGRHAVAALRRHFSQARPLRAELHGTFVAVQRRPGMNLLAKLFGVAFDQILITADQSNKGECGIVRACRWGLSRGSL